MRKSNLDRRLDKIGTDLLRASIDLTKMSDQAKHLAPGLLRLRGTINAASMQLASLLLSPPEREERKETRPTADTLPGQLTLFEDRPPRPEDLGS